MKCEDISLNDSDCIEISWKDLILLYLHLEPTIIRASDSKYYKAAERSQFTNLRTSRGQMSKFSLLRSVMFAPADKMKVLNKAWANTSLDAMVMDMEDATLATDEGKAEARRNVLDFLSTNAPARGHPTAVVRVNCPISTPWGSEDLAQLIPIKPPAIVLPKAEDVELISDVAKDLDDATELWVMVETAKGVQNVDQIAALDKVTALVFGSNDFSKDIGARLTLEREPLVYAMGRTIVAASAQRKTVIDGVFMDLSDGMDDDLRAQCVQGKEMGFDGKSLIHPRQIEIANDVWAPSSEEVEYAGKVIHKYTEAMAAGRGVALLDGKLIESLHMDAAKSLLVQHSLIEDKNRK